VLKRIARFVLLLLLWCLSWQTFNPVIVDQSQPLSSIRALQQSTALATEAFALRGWLSGRGVISWHSTRLPAAALLMVATLGLSPALCSQDQSGTEPDFSKIVFPISISASKDRGLYSKLSDVSGTGFCVNANCSVAFGSYHVDALGTGSQVKIEGVGVKKKVIATGPDDPDATMNSVDENRYQLRYAPGRDLAVYQLRPLSSKGFHGLRFSTEPLRPGQKVDIYGFPAKGSTTYPGARILQLPKIGDLPVPVLTEWHATFLYETDDGVLIFSYDPSGTPITPGASGSIIVDPQSHEVLGILSSASPEKVVVNGQTIPVPNKYVIGAVSVPTMAEFTKRHLPSLYAELFPQNANSFEATNDLILPQAMPAKHPDFVWPKPSGVLMRRQEDPEMEKAIQGLRRKAQELTDQMKDYITDQKIFYGIGEENPRARAQYELQVRDGEQRFREYPHGKKWLDQMPGPAVYPALTSGSEWSELPKKIALNTGVKIVQAPDASVGSQRVKVFEYHATAEDEFFEWDRVFDVDFIHSFRIKFYFEADGEVWTDLDGNILGISANAHGLPDGWGDYRCVVTYDFFTMPGGEQRLKPATFAAQAKDKGKLVWNEGTFTNYKAFMSDVKIGTLFRPAPSLWFRLATSS
jgi:hypothetical protein